PQARGGEPARRRADALRGLIDPAVTAGLTVLAAVDVDLRAVHVGTGFRAQHIDDLGHFVRCPKPVQPNLLLDYLVSAGRQDRGVDFPRRDGVDADAEAAEVRRHL